MPYGLYISASGADAQAQRLEVISHNLANVDTPGFQREVAILQARHSEAIEQKIDQPGSKSLNDIGGGMQVQETMTEFKPGTTRRTGRRTDFAVNKPNVFFMVEKQGREMLTRAGNFLLDPQGKLITQQGDPVLAVGGEHITLDPTEAFTVTDKGGIRQAARRFDLALAQPASMGDMVRVGGNMFRPLAPLRQLIGPTERPDVLHGYVEQSGVSATTEMMSMIEASRAYEANVKMIQNQDHVIGALLNRVLGQ